MNEQLEKFMTEWQGTHVMAYENELVYNVVKGFGKSASFRAMELIATLNLDLIAEAASDSTFIVSMIKEKA